MKAAEKFPWFKCRQSALLGALAALPENEGYAYVVIILRIYEAGGPVHEDAGTIARRTGMAPRRAQAAIDGLLKKGKIDRCENGALDCSRTHADLADRGTKISKASKAGKLSAESRAKNGHKKPKQNQSKAATNVEKNSTNDQRNANHIDLDLDSDLDSDSLFSHENSSDGREIARALEGEGPKVKKTKSDLGTPRSQLEAVLNAELAEAVIQHRAKKRAPLTANAAKLLVGKFVACRDPPAAAEMMIVRGWQSIEPEWFFKEIAKLIPGDLNGQDRRSSFTNHPAEGRSLASISIAARDRGTREKGR